MKKAKMIADRFLHPPKWLIYTVPAASFTALIFVFAANREESVVAYPVFLLSAYSLIILIAALPTLTGTAEAIKSEFLESAADFPREYRLRHLAGDI